MRSGRVLWVHRRSPEQVRYFLSLAHERFQPDELLRQAVAASEAEFDADLLQRPPRAVVGAGRADARGLRERWVWLGAAGQATRQVALGTAVTG